MPIDVHALMSTVNMHRLIGNGMPNKIKLRDRIEKIEEAYHDAKKEWQHTKDPYWQGYVEAMQFALLHLTQKNK